MRCHACSPLHDILDLRVIFFLLPGFLGLPGGPVVSRGPDVIGTFKVCVLLPHLQRRRLGIRIGIQYEYTNEYTVNSVKSQ